MIASRRAQSPDACAEPTSRRPSVYEYDDDPEMTDTLTGTAPRQLPGTPWVSAAEARAVRSPVPGSPLPSPARIGSAWATKWFGGGGGGFGAGAGAVVVVVV